VGQEDAAEAVAAALSGSVARHVFVAGRDDGDRLPIVLALIERARRETARRPRAEARAPAALVAEDLTRMGLFGGLESVRPGAPPRIHPGALLRAEDGVVVVDADRLARTGALWADFRTALRDRRVLLEAAPGTGPNARTLAARSVPLRARVVLVGDEGTYARLFDEDHAFTALVPVKATLERRTRATRAAVRAHVAFAREVAEREGLRPLAASALAILVEESCRASGRQGWLSLRFLRVAEWLRESDRVAGARRARQIEGRDVLAARRRIAVRLGVQERRVFEDVLAGRVLIDTSGRAVGQVNGLAVHDYGNLGLVARITATAGPGRQGVVNVEREVALSGASYDKGVHILTGYLTERLACFRAVAAAIRIVFEQSYEHLTGDSATCAEACAVLSALADVPIRQDLAITGSMNQHGEVQSIGGVTEKIEAFHDLCAARGLTGTQGVVIPRANVPDLMLRPDVVASARAGRFRVHAITRVEEGIALLTDRPAGRTNTPGTFRPGSVFALAADRLARLKRVRPR
jgi:predicted ATP-dependent protease